MRRLCGLDEIADGEARGFDFGRGAEPREVFLVRDGRRVHGYVNSCPHLGTPLEFNPDGFLTADGSAILCSTHGALFRIADGHCFAGPCAGLALTPLDLELAADGGVYLKGLV